MRVFKYLGLIPVIGFVLCSCEGSVRVLPPKSGMSHSHATGCGYMDSYRAGIEAHNMIVRDLTDEEIDEADNADGVGYSDSVKAGKEAKGLAANNVFQDEDDTIIIQEEDGEIIILEDFVACRQCSGHENIHFVEIRKDTMIVEINGELQEIKRKPGYWTNIDPATGEIKQIPIEEMYGFIDLCH